mgnify:CR=1 FL=1
MSANPAKLDSLNRHPLNQAAAVVLNRAREPQDPSNLHVLTLARWGLEQGVMPTSPESQPDHLDRTALEGMLAELRRKPLTAMRLLGETGLLQAPNDLVRQEPKAAARQVLDALVFGAGSRLTTETTVIMNDVARRLSDGDDAQDAHVSALQCHGVAVGPGEPD